jgi:hypothetical protein
MLADYRNIELFTDHASRDNLAQLIAASMVIIFTCSVLYGLFSNNVKPLKVSNKFDLGYIVEDEITQQYEVVVEEQDELKVLKREVEIAKLRKQLVELKARQVHAPNSKNKPKDQVDVNPIIKDCIDALVSMGEKKSVARATVNKYFASNPNTKTVEEFITGVFK